MRDKFLNNIVLNSALIASKWAKLVSVSEFTATYRKVPEEALIRMGKMSFENLGKFLDSQSQRIEIGKFYTDLGILRYNEGYPLCEIHYALHFTKRVLFNYISSEGLLPNTFTLYQANTITVEINDFFDLAGFYITRGFQEALYKKLSGVKGIDKVQIDKIFPKGSFYFEREPEFKTFEKAVESFNIFKVK